MAKYIPPVKGGQVIGRPYQGTHGRAFNQRGGSDNWESENAVDIAVPVGTPIYAVEDGTIGPQFGSQGEGGRFAGLRLHLKAKNGEFYYGHLSQFAPGVKPGEKVKAGQLLGFSGEANGVAHLHFATTTNISPVSVVKGMSATPEATAAIDANTTTDALTGQSSANLNPDGTVKKVPDYAFAQQDAAIQSIPKTGGPPLSQPPLAGDQANTSVTPVQAGANSWQLIASQGQVSPDTLRLAQLAALSGNGGTSNSG